MVEVLGITYKDTAAELGIRLENLKMVIFRARRKILRSMTRTLAEIEVRNARRAAAIREFKSPGGVVRDAASRDAVARDARAERLAPPPHRSSLSTSA